MKKKILFHFWPSVWVQLLESNILRNGFYNFQKKIIPKTVSVQKLSCGSTLAFPKRNFGIAFEIIILLKFFGPKSQKKANFGQKILFFS